MNETVISVSDKDWDNVVNLVSTADAEKLIEGMKEDKREEVEGERFVNRLG